MKNVEVKICKQCGELKSIAPGNDICNACAKANVKEIFDEDPRVKDAFAETIKEMKSDIFGLDNF